MCNASCDNCRDLKLTATTVSDFPPQRGEIMALNKKTKAELPKMLLENFGEHAYARWTKAEIVTRIRELQEAQGIDPWAKGKTRTPLREQVTQLNRHKKTKAMLTEYVGNELGMMLNGNETMEQIEYRAIREIYRRANPSGEDPVGFGRHASLSYAEILREQPGYVAWVKKTAIESNEADPRLLRLAAWLENQKKPETKEKEVLKLVGANLRELKVYVGAACVFHECMKLGSTACRNKITLGVFR